MSYFGDLPIDIIGNLPIDIITIMKLRCLNNDHKLLFKNNKIVSKNKILKELHIISYQEKECKKFMQKDRFKYENKTQMIKVMAVYCCRKDYIELFKSILNNNLNMVDLIQLAIEYGSYKIVEYIMEIKINKLIEYKFDEKTDKQLDELYNDITDPTKYDVLNNYQNDMLGYEIRITEENDNRPIERVSEDVYIDLKSINVFFDRMCEYFRVAIKYNKINILIKLYNLFTQYNKELIKCELYIQLYETKYDWYCIKKHNLKLNDIISKEYQYIVSHDCGDILEYLNENLDDKSIIYNQIMYFYGGINGLIERNKINIMRVICKYNIEIDIYTVYDNCTKSKQMLELLLPKIKDKCNYTYKKQLLEKVCYELDLVIMNMVWNVFKDNITIKDLEEINDKIKDVKELTKFQIAKISRWLNEKISEK